MTDDAAHNGFSRCARAMTGRLEGAFDDVLRRFDRDQIELMLVRRFSDKGDCARLDRDWVSSFRNFLTAGVFLRSDFAYKNAFDARYAIDNATHLAEAATRLGRRAEAKYFTLESARLDPGHAEKQVSAAETMARHGRPDEMRRYFERELARVPESRLAAFFLEVMRIFPAVVDETRQALSGGVDGKRKLAVVMPVWGKKHVEQAGRYAIPMLLAEGNLPSLAERFDLRFIFFTKQEDRTRISNLDCYDALSRVADVYFVPYPDALMACSDNRIARFQLLSLAHYALLEAVRQTGDVAAFAFPDNVINDGFFAAAGRHLEAGAGAVSSIVFRLRTKDVVPAVDQRYRRADGVIRIPAQSLVRLLLDHLPEEWFAESKRFTRFPFTVCWREGRDTLHARASHFQPYMISGRHLRGPIHPSIDPIDARFLLRYAKNLDDIVFIESEEMCAVDAGPAPLLDTEPVPEESFDERRFALFTLEYDSELARRCLNTPVCLSASGGSRGSRSAIRRITQAMKTAEAIMDEVIAAAPARPEWAARADQAAW